MTARHSGSLFRKYVVAFAVVVVFPLLTYSAVNSWFTYREHRAALAQMQRGQAEAAAFRITQFIKEIEGQLSWATHLPWSDALREQHRIDALRLLRQVPAITDLTLLDGDGRERLHVSRFSLERVGVATDLSADRRFVEALANRIHYGPVYFRRETEPFMTLAMAGTRREFGVVIAEVNLKHIWDVVAQIRIGRAGTAYVVDGHGRLIAHPDISLVLRNSDPSDLFPRTGAPPAADGNGEELPRVVSGLQGRRVLTSDAAATPLDWRVHIELPESEADEPLYAALVRAVFVTAAGLVLALAFAFVLALRMVDPIRALTAGAARIGSGRLDHRICIRTGDELEVLGRQFNTMATDLESSYTNLERKVTERTQDLAAANQAKSRFIAAASHDLRQPLHALNLMVAQLRAEPDPEERVRLAVRIESAVANLNELFGGILDISRLDAGVVAHNLADFPIGRLLQRIEAVFAADAAAKGLRLRVFASRAWVRSDPNLLDRILMNLIANAIRYTPRGGIVVGCRRVGQDLRIDVCDSGIGIPADKQQQIFAEFYQVAPAAAGRGEGLGLGLAIVQRLCALLGHRVQVASAPGAGSRFSVHVPRAAMRAPVEGLQGAPLAAIDPMHGRRVVVIDNDPRVLESTSGLLRTWGCDVVTAASGRAALERLGAARPDLVIADFHLGDGEEGIAAIAMLRSRYGGAIAAFLVSGDISPQLRQRATGCGLDLLHKPVTPMALRAMSSRMLADAGRGQAGD
jgi:signal transduction histidine kinase/CheY-like chemotaxis protein